MDHKSKRRSSDISRDDLHNIHGSVRKFNYVCSIANFSQRLEKTGERIRSPNCVVGSQYRSEWYLRIYPNGANGDSKDYVSVYLALSKPVSAEIKCRFSILNNKEEEKNICVVKNTAEVGNRGWGFSKFVRRDSLLNKSNGLLVEDKLTILCEIEIIELKLEEHDKRETSINVTKPQSNLSLELGNSSDSSLFSDCSIKVGETTIKVHRGILATKSHIFYNFFNSTPENSQMNTIEIKNFRAEVVKEMIRYIYTNDISDIGNMASDVLAIAVEYGLDGLKDIAVRHLCRNLNTENICELFCYYIGITTNCKIFIIADDLCNIRSRVTEFNSVCSLRNFSSLLGKIGERHTSPSFGVGNEDKPELCLKVYPNGDKGDSNDYVSVYLILLKPGKARVLKYYKISILNDKEEEKHICIVDKVTGIDGRCWGFSKYVKRDFLLNESNGLLINDTLRILCEAEFIDPGNLQASMNVIIPETRLSSGYGNLFESQSFTDCIIKVGNAEIKVHRGILATRSHVFFYDIFNSTPENPQTNIIEIENFHIENVANELLAIAVEHGLDRLKVVAVKYLCGDLNIEDVCERFILSETFSSKELKECCQVFIIDNAGDLMDTNNWKELVKNHPLLVESLFFELLNLPSTSK
uniref:BTB domain-containing protein n=1 Tax=Strongyloides papillosus TaxID=174720 RepID=A0A0N5CEC6_STREA